MSQEQFDELFPNRVNINLLTYLNFLKAVAKFKDFCDYADELNEAQNNKDIDEACKRELATLFAHMTYETGDKDLAWAAYETTGLRVMRDENCRSEPLLVAN